MKMEKVLERASTALDKSGDKVPAFVWRSCKGVAIINVTEVGFVFSLAEGDGIVIKKNDDGTWGSPSAIMFTGASGGAVFGKADKQIFLFPTTELGLRMLAGPTTYQLGVQAGFAAGPVGGEAEAGGDVGGKGADVTWSYVFSNGAFLNVGINNHFIDNMDPVNKNFYGAEVAALDIVNNPGAVEVPEGKGVKTLQEKLSTLSAKK